MLKCRKKKKNWSYKKTLNIYNNISHIVKKMYFSYFRPFLISIILCNNKILFSYRPNIRNVSIFIRYDWIIYWLTMLSSNLIESITQTICVYRYLLFIKNFLLEKLCTITSSKIYWFDTKLYCIFRFIKLRSKIINV